MGIKAILVPALFIIILFVVSLGLALITYGTSSHAKDTSCKDTTVGGTAKIFGWMMFLPGLVGSFVYGYYIFSQFRGI